MDIGRKIKRLRAQKALTQQELASRCDLSKGFISQIERNLTSPSIATLVDILESLGSNLKNFFNDDEDEKIVFGQEDIFETEDEQCSYNLQWLVPNAQKNQMEPILLTLNPGGRYKEDEPHEGEEFGYVISGCISLQLGSKSYKVKKGESFYYKASSNHYISNDGKTAAKLIWASTPPSF